MPVQYLSEALFIFAGRLHAFTYRCRLPGTFLRTLIKIAYLTEYFQIQTRSHIHPRGQSFTVTVIHLLQTNWGVNHCQDDLQDQLKPIRHTYQDTHPDTHQDTHQDAHKEAHAVLWSQDWLQHSFQQAGRELFTGIYKLSFISAIC